MTLFDRNPEVARSLADAFRGVAGVEVLEGDLLGLECEAIVSPANSFGYMDGGIDRHIDQSFGGKAQEAVLSLITGRFRGELPVGSAAVIAMSPGHFPFLVVAPTMRVPGDDLDGTINAYLAMRAAFVAILNHNEGGTRRIGSVALPGLGTGVGGMSPEDSALQMQAAYEMIVAGAGKTSSIPPRPPS